MSTIKDMFRIKDLRNKIFFTAAIFFLIRMVSQVPVPGVNSGFIESYFAANGVFSFIDAFTGGGFSNFSILALSITPYITASIIIQLLTIAIPKLEELQKEGTTGKKVITKITRILTVALSVLESVALCIGFGSSMLIEFTVLNVIAVTAVMTAGNTRSSVLAERINEHGIGNGISMILLLNIASRIPSDIVSLYQQFIAGHTIAESAVNWAIIAAVIIAVFLFSIILNEAHRDIPVQYANKFNRTTNQSPASCIPIKTNVSGVVPVIFATSIMAIPGMVMSFAQIQATGFMGTIVSALSPSNWFDPADWLPTAGIAVYALLLIFFAYFYAQINYNPSLIADNLRKSGGTIPGYRPGEPTAAYINNVLKGQVFIGSMGLIIITAVSYFFNGMFNAGVSFGGTSLLIIVSVLTDSARQASTTMKEHHYKGFIN